MISLTNFRHTLLHSNIGRTLSHASLPKRRLITSIPSSISSSIGLTAKKWTTVQAKPQHSCVKTFRNFSTQNKDNKEQIEITEKFYEMGRKLQIEGNFGEAKINFENSLIAHESAYGDKETITLAHVFLELGNCFLFEANVAHELKNSSLYNEKREKAKDYYERSLEIGRKLNTDKELIAKATFQLGNISYLEKEWYTAKDLHKESLEIRKEIHGTEEHPLIAASNHILGMIYLNLANIGFEKAVEVSKTDSKDLTYPMLGMLDQLTAKNHFEKALKISRTLYKDDNHPLIQTILSEMNEYFKPQDS